MGYEHSIEVEIKVRWWQFLGMALVFLAGVLTFVVVFATMGIVSFIWSKRNYFAMALFLILLTGIALYYFR